MKIIKKDSCVVFLFSFSALFAAAQKVASFPIPVDKGLTADWISSLTAPGKPEVWSGDELRYIGMPVGGMACGQLYLAGDGRLWLWDIFKTNYSREDISGLGFDLMTMNGHYTKPVDSDGGVYSLRNGAKVDQGFAVSVKAGGDAQLRTLDRKGFPDVQFRGEYPIGKVTYRDKNFPLTIQMEAFSPFVPLDAENSAIPATILAFTVTNTGKTAAEVDLMGWLQNAVCPYDNDADLGKRVNRIIRQSGLATLHSTVYAIPGKGLEKRHGYGSMALSLLNPQTAMVIGEAETVLPLAPASFKKHPAVNESATKPLSEKLTGSLGQRLLVSPGKSKSVTFLLSWYFPLHQQKDKDKKGEMNLIKNFDQLNRHYKPWFTDAAGVARKVQREYGHLYGDTKKWNEVWYNSTLPIWLLDRTMISVDALSSQTAHWFDNGRFWGWEGVDACGGTCTHVWSYAQAMSRLFPQIERSIREHTDYDIAFKPNGSIGNRGEFEQAAMDGQAGTIVRTWREHILSKDDSFLKRIWPQAKRAVQWMISQDPQQQGIIEGPQGNTLDAVWNGPMAWISSAYCAALRAGEQMAIEMGDKEFAATCAGIASKGYENMVTRIFNGEYFIHIPQDYTHINTNKGCHIDQVLGQSWAFQTGLPRVLPKAQTESALNAIWKYNFAPDAGTYAIDHRVIKGHRTYAMPGEAGLLMTTWPNGGDSVAVPKFLRAAWSNSGDSVVTGVEDKEEDFKSWIGPGGYFDECMNGFEYQAASHMIYEGQPGSDLVMNGLSIFKAVHNRYAANKRNPYNEIECGDHYVRSMAAYGVFLAVCGFEYHGPKGHIGFAPKITPENFKAPFTAAEGWGTYTQKRTVSGQQHSIAIAYGALQLQSLTFQKMNGTMATTVKVLSGVKPLASKFTVEGDKIVINLDRRYTLEKNQTLSIVVR